VATTTISVAIYPYVPRPQQFTAAISEAWQSQEPGVELKFVEWDCYSEDPLPDLDVFVFDAIFLDNFQSRGFLDPIAADEVVDAGDLLPYALEGSYVDGTLYGIPQLGCGSILFYRKDDAALAAADNLGEVEDAIGECTYQGLTPPQNVGLMVDLSGGTTDAALYLEAVQDIYGTYTTDPPLPPDASKINSWSIQNLQKLLRMASVQQANYSGEPYQRASWFGNEGLGRATVGFTEAMSAMGESGRESVAFKLMPLSNRTGVSLFYADIIGINPSTSASGKRDLALKLANLMASTSVMVSSINATAQDDYPQYLMPTRTSIFQEMEKQFPLYGEMHHLVTDNTPELFRFGPTSRDWLSAMKSKIRDEIFTEPCPPCSEDVPSELDAGPLERLSRPGQEIFSLQ